MCTQVEIVMRVLRQWTKHDDEVLDPEAVRIADLTVRVSVIDHVPSHSVTLVCTLTL